MPNHFAFIHIVLLYHRKRHPMRYRHIFRQSLAYLIPELTVCVTAKKVRCRRDSLQHFSIFITPRCLNRKQQRFRSFFRHFACRVPHRVIHSITIPHAVWPHFCKFKQPIQRTLCIAFCRVPIVVIVCIITQSGNSLFQHRDAFSSRLAVDRTNSFFPEHIITPIELSIIPCDVAHQFFCSTHNSHAACNKMYAIRFKRFMRYRVTK
nr:MAG TPA: hypothetical protein [Caudoviricetes sp.]